MNKQINTVMIVDDTPANLKTLHEILKKNNYRVVAFPNGEMAIRAAEKSTPDLVLLDIMMPGIDGFEVCKYFKKIPSLKDTPIIFISALNNSEDKTLAFDLGGVDYITKPFQPDEIIARVKTHIKMHEMQLKLEEYNHQLEDMVNQKVKEVLDSQKAASLALAKLTESRDYETGKHVDRVQIFCRVLAQELRDSIYKEDITADFIENIYYASPLHDIGKVGIPDNILLKPGKLTLEEFEIIKTHVCIGASTLESIFLLYPNNKIIEMGIEISKYHHERWDGKGYMEGLEGDRIPLSARIMALVDVYDALRSERPYKKAFTHREACARVEGDLGSHFDPVVGEAFREAESIFEEIYEEFKEQ